MALTIDNKVTVTINGVAIKVPQGLNTFQDIIAPAVQKGACTAKAKLITVTTAAASQNSTVNPNSSYIISGGEVMTIA
jgi:hypothetical protein